MELLASVDVIRRSQTQLQDLPHVLSAINVYADALALWTIEIAASTGLLRLLYRLAAREPPLVHAALGKSRTIRGIQNAVSSGRVDVLKWWVMRYRPEHVLSDSEYVDLMAEAARRGHLDVLEWIHTEFKTPLYERDPNWRLRAHQADVVYWLHDQGLPVMVSPEEVVRTGGPAFLQWLLDHNADFDMRGYSYAITMANAMKRSDLATIQWLIANLLRTGFNEAMLSTRFEFGRLTKIWKKRWPRQYYRDAQSNYRYYDPTQLYLPEPLEVTEDHLRVFRWLHNEFEWKDPRLRDRWVDCVALQAASCNNFEMIMALQKPEDEALGERARGTANRFHLPMWLAAFHGHLDMVQWLYAHGSHLEMNDAMDGAAAGGHLGIVQWLYRNQSYGPKMEVMDVAAWNGHIDILQWLKENAPEYKCTQRAMNLAAGRGYLRVIQWLHANRSEGCTKKAIEYAIANGHLSVVQYLMENFSKLCTRISFNKAVLSGHVEVVEY